MFEHTSCSELQPKPISAPPIEKTSPRHIKCIIQNADDTETIMASESSLLIPHFREASSPQHLSSDRASNLCCTTCAHAKTQSVFTLPDPYSGSSSSGGAPLLVDSSTLSHKHTQVKNTSLMLSMCPMLFTLFVFSQGERCRNQLQRCARRGGSRLNGSVLIQVNRIQVQRKHGETNKKRA